jgi:hypothetical protein|tara:strand:+ start:748 stop:1575 length:828 start_codon:yes stop_codon:yes gene_type:complete
MIHIIYNFLSLLRNNKIKAEKDYTSSRNIYLSGYPISGNSWIAYLITYIINCKYFDIDALVWSKQRLTLKKYLDGKNKHIGSKIFKNLYKTHEKIDLLPNSNKDVIIYVVRDVRDVCNSYFHRFEKVYAISNHETSFLRKSIYFFYRKLIPYKYGYRFLIRYFAYEWSIHVNELFKAKNVILILYEDMIDNPLKSLERIINNIDPLAWDKNIAVNAIEKFSFKNLKKTALKTTTYNIKTDRVGTYGDWKKYFSDKDTIFFEKKYIPIMAKLKKNK